MNGGDEILGSNVFGLLNAIYRLRQAPIVYTNHFYGSMQIKKLFKGNSVAYLPESKPNQYRSIKQKIGPLRTFKVNLFLQVKAVDLQ